MNDATIEKILRKAPAPKLPGGLMEKLQADIVLPRAGFERRPRNDWRPVLRRWLPALSLSGFLLACLVAIAVQSNMVSELRQENRQLQTSTSDLERLRGDNAEYQRLFAENQQLGQLRKDNAELEKLRNEITQLREQVQELAQLRAENQRLLAQQKAGEAAGVLGEDPFAEAKKKAQSTECVNNLKQIGLGLRLWANEHNKAFPPDFLTAQNELNSPRILACPSDTARTQRFPVWTGFGPADATYEYFVPPQDAERKSPRLVMTRCPIHGHVGLAEGTAHADSWKRATQKDGRWVLEN